MNIEKFFDDYRFNFGMIIKVFLSDYGVNFVS